MSEFYIERFFQDLAQDITSADSIEKAIRLLKRGVKEVRYSTNDPSLRAYLFTYLNKAFASNPLHETSEQ